MDHARRRRAVRRGGGKRPRSLNELPLDSAIDAFESERGFDLLELDEALVRLQNRSERQADVVTMRFFGGYDMREISEYLQVSLSTIEGDWRVARSWLRRELEPTD